MALVLKLIDRVKWGREIEIDRSKERKRLTQREKNRKGDKGEQTRKKLRLTKV